MIDAVTRAFATFAAFALLSRRQRVGAVVIARIHRNAAIAFTALAATARALRRIGVWRWHLNSALTITTSVITTPVVAAGPLAVAAAPAFITTAPIVVAIVNPAAIALWPTRRPWRCVVVMIMPTTLMPWPVMMAPVMIPPAIFAIPIMAAFAPIAPVMVAHGISSAYIIEQIETVARIPEAVIPAATIADIVKTLAIIALIIIIISAIGITIIAVVIIAIVIIVVAGVTQAHVICAPRYGNTRRCQRRDPEKSLPVEIHHLLYPRCQRRPSPLNDWASDRPIILSRLRFPS